MEIEVKYTTQKDLHDIELKLKQSYQDLKFLGELFLPAIYYDTADSRLEKNKAVLRVRSENQKWVGCYKTHTQKKRIFIEEEIELTPKEAQLTDWVQRLEHYSQIKDIIGQKTFLPTAKIETIRRIYHLDFQGLVLEFALDEVTYQNGLFSENRLEIELHQGDYQDFLEFVFRFSLRFPELQETDVAKYQQAKKSIDESRTNKHK